MDFLATFYTHFAAQTFLRGLKSFGLKGKMMPVPRKLSASCGTCVSFECSGDFMPLLVEDTEGIYRVEGETYSLVYEHKDEE